MSDIKYQMSDVLVNAKSKKYEKKVTILNDIKSN